MGLAVGAGRRLRRLVCSEDGGQGEDTLGMGTGEGVCRQRGTACAHVTRKAGGKSRGSPHPGAGKPFYYIPPPPPSPEDPRSVDERPAYRVVARVVYQLDRFLQGF